VKCPVCNREVREGASNCSSCGLTLNFQSEVLEDVWQPSAGQFHLGKRLGSIALDVGIFVFTLGVGWLIWQLVLLNRSQSPGKQILQLRVEEFGGSSAPILKYLLRLFSLPLAAISIVLVAFVGLSLTGRPVSQAWLLAFSQLISLILVIVDFGSIFTPKRSRLTDQILRTKVAFGANVLG
jgi:uncharacterized RDD family membrane protein YckC